MNVNGYELTTEWKVSNIGHTARAQKGSKKYFLKRYGETKMPKHSASTSDALYDRLKEEFESFRAYRIEINEALKAFGIVGGLVLEDGGMLWCATEMNDKGAIDFLIDMLWDITEGGKE